MALEIEIIITDAAPLITLAAASSLDYLLYPDLPVIIPDAVFYEATGAADKLGAQEIIGWYRDHSDRVRIEPTEIFRRETTLLRQTAERLPRDLGERAALEVVRSTPFLKRAEDRALLISDDRDVERLVVVDPERLILLTTWDYLRQLEAAQRIQSAAAVMEAVREKGRNPPQRELWSNHDPEVREAVKAILDNAHRTDPRR